MNGKIVVSVLVASVMIAASSPAYSCSCVQAPAPAEALKQADAVLLGKVIDIQDGPGPYHITAKLSVTKIWKGEKDFSAKILTTSDGAMCGFYFQEGKTFLIYAYKNQEGRLETNNCTRSALAERASQDLAFLTTQPGVTRRASGCGCDNILAGDIYLFAGVFVYLFRQRASRRFRRHAMM